MTKFAHLKVTVPVDDDLPVIAIRDHVQRKLEAWVTERMEIPRPPKPEGQAPADAELPGTPAPTGRIHWQAVSVVLYIERAAPAVQSKRKNGAKGAPN